jgi:hypothetical protein
LSRLLQTDRSLENLPILDEKDNRLTGFRQKLRQELLELLAEGEFAWACSIGRDLETLAQPIRYISN